MVDNGTFEAAGFRFWAETWRPGEDGCCHLHIRPAEFPVLLKPFDDIRLRGFLLEGGSGDAAPH